MDIISKKYSYFSIGIPVYNCEKYIKSCLDSIISQSFSDFEIICVDDSSSDSSFDILSKYAKNDKRIKLFRNSCNLGVGKTRERITQIASSKYFVWIDADDTICPGYLNNLYKKTLAFPEEKTVLIHNAHIIKNKKTRLLYKKRIWETKNIERVYESMVLGNQLYSYPWSFVIPTIIIKSINYNDRCRDFVDDQLTSFKYCISSSMVSYDGYISGYNHYIRKNSDSKNSTFFYRLSNTYKNNSMYFAQHYNKQYIVSALNILSKIYLCLGTLKDESVSKEKQKNIVFETKSFLKPYDVSSFKGYKFPLKIRIWILTLKKIPLAFYIKYRGR